VVSRKKTILRRDEVLGKAIGGGVGVVAFAGQSNGTGFQMECFPGRRENESRSRVWVFGPIEDVQDLQRQRTLHLGALVGLALWGIRSESDQRALARHARGLTTQNALAAVGPGKT
jgi:hypothetical protein